MPQPFSGSTYLMQAPPFRPVLIAAALSACSAQPEQLNSDRIKERYGSYGIAIVSQDLVLRRSSLYSVDGEQRTSRTYSIVQYVGPDAAAISASHDKILGGASIGATFRDDGWDVHKLTAHIGSVSLSDMTHPVALRMRLDAPHELAMHVYELHVERGDQRLHYATIIETHHPDYMTLDDLHDAYPMIADEALPDNEVAGLVALVLAGD